MAKTIKVTPNMIDKIRAEFETAIQGLKSPDGTFTFTRQIGAVSRKAVIRFTESAWLKMQVLVNETDKEIAWNGTARRGDDPEKDEYIIDDILVYPQRITGTTVQSEHAEYDAWQYMLPDEIFNNLRFQGHSHVNMGVTPSGTDLTLYSDLLSMLKEDMFYIFMIWNKRGEKMIKLYDMKKNVLFETADCTVEVIREPGGIYEFLDESRKMIKNAGNITTFPSAIASAPSAASEFAAKTGAAVPVPAQPVKQVSVAQGPKQSDSRKGKRSKRGRKIFSGTSYSKDSWRDCFDEEHPFSRSGMFSNC